MSIEEKIEALVAKLDRIANKNGDEFVYRIKLHRHRQIINFSFEAIETADNHTFVSGGGNTIAEAVDCAEKGIPASCEAWSYYQL